MQYQATNPKDYINELEQDWRKETLLTVRSILLSQGLEEVIEYKMLGYRDSGKTVFNLNAQKNYVSLYVGDKSKVDASGELLAGLDAGKGCIRIKKGVNVTDTRLTEFIENAIKLSHKGVDIGC